MLFLNKVKQKLVSHKYKKKNKISNINIKKYKIKWLVKKIKKKIDEVSKNNIELVILVLLVIL